jgi:hypothetical protein
MEVRAGVLSVFACRGASLLLWRRVVEGRVFLMLDGGDEWWRTGRWSARLESYRRAMR